MLHWLNGLERVARARAPPPPPPPPPHAPEGAALDTPEARGRSFDVVSSPPGEGAAFSGDMAALLSSLSGENCDYSKPANLEELLG